MKEKLKHYRLNQEEYDRICTLLKREPQGVEWALFSALWSEHCSYKSSRVHLKKFSYKSKRVLESFGENAGVVDLGEGERVAFKMESHNHPSFIEPFQGATTGVGGILRDIFTMGARPIALANYLCFGAPKAARMTELVDGVVRGIGGYGNCVGVPTITGQTEFHESYNGNILVNALALGLFLPGEHVVNSRARGIGNLLVYVGAKTGRDGVHGASMASESFDETSASKRPTVQIGDPFYEKLLIEGCLDVFKAGLVVAIQDMGAAGLTSSSFEMAYKGGVGLNINLDQVPLRDNSLTPEDILLSESQERMLLVATPENLPAIQKIFSKYTLDAAVIGELTEGPEVNLFWHGEKLTSIDPAILTDEAPMYQRPTTEPSTKNKKSALTPLPKADALESLKKVLRSVQGCSREWIFNQYDQRVGTKTARDCTSPVGVLQLPSERLMGLVLGCRPHVMRLNAALGAQDAAIYSCLELAVLGFEPIALTDCLNFGSPENPAVMGEFKASVEALAHVAEVFEAPVISGNVSLYNETMGQSVTSTPSIGAVGLRARTAGLPQSHFVSEGDQIFLISNKNVQTTGLYAELSALPQEYVGEMDVRSQRQFCDRLRNVAVEAPVRSARVVGKFGLAYALARMCTEELGCTIEAGTDPFVETFYEVVISGPQELATHFENTGLAFKRIGHVSAKTFEIKGSLKTSTQEILNNYQSGFGDHFAKLS